MTDQNGTASANGITDPSLLEALEVAERELAVEEDEAPKEEEQEEVVEEIDEDASEDPDSEQASPADEQEQEEAKEEERLILGKFKSQEDLEKSYSELEKRLRGISSERAAKESELELLRKQLQERQELENKLSKQEDDFDSAWEEDPKEAVKRTLKQQEEKQAQERKQLEQQQRAQAANEFYLKEKEQNPDFAAREQDMVEVAKKVGALIAPEYLNSPQTVELLYYAARGMKVADYEKAAVEKVKKEQQARASVKKKARSESSTSIPSDPGLIEDMSAFANMSEEEMQEELKRSARTIGRAR